MKNLWTTFVTVCAVLGALAGCGSAGAAGDLAELVRLAETCPDAELAAYVGVDFSDTARAETLTRDRQAAVEGEAERVAVCGGTFKVVAFSSSTAATVTLFDGRLEPEGATQNAQLRRVDRTLEPVKQQILAEWDKAETTLPGDGSDVVGQFTLAAEFFAQRPDAAHRAVFLTDGVQTTGAVVLNTADFTPAVATDLASKLTLPDLTGADVTVAGLGRVAGEPPPSEFVDALNRFFTDACNNTHATCQVVTDLASN
jgi:hypothetical protein